MTARTTTLLAAGFVGWCTLACATPPSEPAPPAVAPGTPPSPEPVAPPAPSECTNDCLLLLEHDYRDLQDGAFCDLCGPTNPQACTTGWPRARLTCDQVDYLRNCIYARLGYEFETAPEWREVFDKEPWYTPRSDFQWSDVKPIQVRNAKRLKKMQDTRDCAR